MGNFFLFRCCWDDEEEDSYQRYYDPSYRRSASTAAQHYHDTGSGQVTASSGGMPLMTEERRHSPENSNALQIPDTSRKYGGDSRIHANLVPRSLEEERSYMVRSMSSSLMMELQKEPECLFCLDGFTEDDPCIKSLCGCGVNKNPMHAKCLEIWQTKSSECPVCTQRLFYETSTTVELKERNEHQ